MIFLWRLSGKYLLYLLYFDWFWFSFNFFWVIWWVSWTIYQPFTGQVQWWEFHLKLLNRLVGPTSVWSLPFDLICLAGPGRSFCPAYIVLRIARMHKPSHHIKIKNQPPFCWLQESIQQLKQGKRMVQFKGGGHTDTTFKSNIEFV